MKTNNMITLNLVLVALVMAAPLFSQQWSEPILISGGDTPDMDIDPLTGNLYILSMKNGVMLTKVSPDGLILSQENVPGAEYDEGGGRFGASVAVDINGYPHVCYRCYEGDDPDGAPTYSAYYIKKAASGWQNKIKLSQNVRRGYVVRIDVDRNNAAHIAQGFVFDEEGSIHGRIKYFRIKNNSIEKQEELGTAAPYIYRGDDRIEITTRPAGNVHIVSGVPDPNGRVYYLFSTDGGDHFTNWGDIHNAECFGRNGSPDLAVDSTDYIHVCYGASEDNTRKGLPSVRYARFFQNSKLVDKAATPEGLLVDWKIGMGLGSIACTDDGQVIIIAFSEQPGGKLYTTLSQNMGTSWELPVEIVPASGSDEGRNKHIIRSRGDDFYLVYPHNHNIYLRLTTEHANKPPYANAGGPYNSPEGSTIAFDASNSKDPDGTIVKYEWDWQNDDVYDATTTSAIYNYAYSDNFSGQVKLRVIDNGGLTNTGVVSVTVSNVNPVAQAGGPYAGLPNENIQCQGAATDPGKNDVLNYQWDLDFDGIFETMGQNVYAKFSTGGNYKIVLRVSDDDGGAGLDTATVQIASKPPVVSPIPSQSVNEGNPFNIISLDDYVTDPDNSDAEIKWEVHGNKNLNVTIDANRRATIAPIDQNWYGAEILTFIASEPSQLKDSTAATFTITNVNDPPVILPIGDRTTDEGKNFDPIHLDDYVTDSDNAVAEISWRIAGNLKLGYEITNRVLTVCPLNAEWSGNERLTLIATDLGGLSDTTTVLFSVNPINDPPVVSKIPDQQILEGQNFQPIYLDGYVTDSDHSDSQVTWHISGNKELNVAIENRVATIKTPDENWNGTEIIKFKAIDPTGLADSSLTLFRVFPVNDPPELAAFPEFQIPEDDTLIWNFSYLRSLVTDPDNSPADFKFIISNLMKLTWQSNIQKEQIIIFGPLNWYGAETISVQVFDGAGGADSQPCKISVVSVPDPLAPFSILYPTGQAFSATGDTIRFLWHKTIDPEGGSPMYQLSIADDASFHHVVDQYNNLLDTSFTYLPKLPQENQWYYWKILAFNSVGFTASNLGSFQILKTGVKGNDLLAIPNDFALLQNYPNPFNPETWLVYQLPEKSLITLEIFNSLGQRVAVLEDGFKEAGTHKIKWDVLNTSGQRLPSGIYICRMKAGDRYFYIKMALLQ